MSAWLFELATLWIAAAEDLFKLVAVAGQIEIS